MNAVLASQKRAINIKEIGGLQIPAKSVPEKNPRFSGRSFRERASRYCGRQEGGCLFLQTIASCLTLRQLLFHSKLAEVLTPVGAVMHDYDPAVFRISKAGRSLRGGLFSPIRICTRSRSNSAMVRLRVLRCMPISRAALHWFP